MLQICFHPYKNLKLALFIGFLGVDVDLIEWRRFNNALLRWEEWNLFKRAHRCPISFSSSHPAGIKRIAVKIHAQQNELFFFANHRLHHSLTPSLFLFILPLVRLFMPNQDQDKPLSEIHLIFCEERRFFHPFRPTPSSNPPPGSL
jgi:hypothetical protein